MFPIDIGHVSSRKHSDTRTTVGIKFPRYLKYWATLFLCLFSLCATAIPITGATAKVVMCVKPFQNRMAIFNPILEYGNPIRYVRLGYPLYVVFGGIEYELDIDAAVEEAMAEWTAAVPMLRFQSVAEGLENGKTWKIRISSLQVSRLGSGYMTGTQTTTSNPELVFYNSGFLEAAGEFHLNVKFMKSMQMSNYLRFLLRLTAKHEVGHLLGFKHAPGVGDPEDEQDANGCPLQAIFNPTQIAAGPPIMTRNLATTLRLMDGYFERRLQIEDIQIAPQEAAMARAVFERPCPVNIEDIEEPPPEVEAPTCPAPERLVPAFNPGIFPSLMD